MCVCKYTFNVLVNLKLYPFQLLKFSFIYNVTQSSFHSSDYMRKKYAIFPQNN